MRLGVLFLFCLWLTCCVLGEVLTESFDHALRGASFELKAHLEDKILFLKKIQNLFS